MSPLTETVRATKYLTRHDPSPSKSKHFPHHARPAPTSRPLLACFTKNAFSQHWKREEVPFRGTNLKTQQDHSIALGKDYKTSAGTLSLKINISEVTANSLIGQNWVFPQGTPLQTPTDTTPHLFKLPLTPPPSRNTTPSGGLTGSARVRVRILRREVFL
jgi:hypothetical protein